MDDRRRHGSLSHLGLFAIVAAAGLAALKGRSQARMGFRLLGLWAYLSVVNRGGPNVGLARDINRCCTDDDIVAPYWGYQPLLSAQRLPRPTPPHRLRQPVS